ncbi:MAG: choice-of-anchor Q domain-containing protein [Lysobacteraceae bacterium]
MSLSSHAPTIGAWWLVVNNLVWNAAGNARLVTGAGNTSYSIGHNVAGAFLFTGNRLEIGPNLTLTPGLVNPNAGDFRLLPDSPLVDLGATGVEVGDYDAAGDPRWMGASLDIGACEEQTHLFRDGFE